MRQTELVEVTKVLNTINSGNGSSVAQSNSRKEGDSLGTTWSNRLDLPNIIISGHSFGANSVLEYLSQSNSSVFLPAGAGAAFDPGKDSGPFPNETVTVPLLIPDSEEWDGVPTDFYGRQHFDVVKGIAQVALKASDAAWFMTLLGTVHTSITDVGLIAASFETFFTNYTQFITLDAKAAILQYINVTTDFVTYVQNRSTANVHGILASGVTYENFQLFPNASTLSTPWEVHVAPNL
jgi:platelet-activating factor acetylhydrolase